MILSVLCALWAGASLRVCGSETLGRAAAAWSEGWNALSPTVAVETHFPGSGTSLSALSEGTCQVALLSRAPDPRALDQVRLRLQDRILLEQVGWDEVVFFVHPDSKVRNLTLKELREILIKPQPGWHPYGRNALSGTRSWVQERILGGWPFSPLTRELPGPAGVVRAVSGDLKGIGYSGREAIHGQVRILTLSDSLGQSRRLFRPLYLARAARDGLAAQFSRYVLSPDGQSHMDNCGLIPLEPR